MSNSRKVLPALDGVDAVLKLVKLNLKKFTDEQVAELADMALFESWDREVNSNQSLGLYDDEAFKDEDDKIED